MKEMGTDLRKYIAFMNEILKHYKRDSERKFPLPYPGLLLEFCNESCDAHMLPYKPRPYFLLHYLLLYLSIITGYKRVPHFYTVSLRVLPKLYS